MTTSTPPAWHFLHECDAPVEAPKPPDSDALREWNGSNPDPTYQDCWPSERYKSDGPDQCSECRCPPGQPHNPECDISRSPDVSCDRKDDAPGCDEAAQVTNAQSNAVETYVFPEIGQFPGQETGVAEETHEDLQGKDADSFVVASCPECGAVADIDYGTVGDKPLDKTTWTVLLTDGYREMAEENLEAAEAFVGACEPEPARSAIGAGPLFSSRFADKMADTFDVPFGVQEFIFEELAEVQAEYLHDILKDHTPLIVEMARDRFRKGYAKYGSAAYQWDAETRLTNVLEELADSVVYLTTGAIE